MRLKAAPDSALKISARRSDLARLQARSVGEALIAANPGLRIDYLFSESLGDKNLTDPLWKMPEKGVFTEDLTRDLMNGATDLVVHSWKDLPVEENPQTEIVATLPRADARDLLLFKKSSRLRLAGEGTVRIFSSSPRREYNLKPFLRDHLPALKGGLEFLSVRGNIPTRVRKLLETADVDGLVVAKAALDRLLGATADEFAEARGFLRGAVNECDFMVLPLSANPSAAAQGALAIEIRRDRADLRERLSKIHDEATFLEAREERAILKSHGGGCHQKIGITILHRPGGRLVFARGRTDAGAELRECRWEGSAGGTPEIVRSAALFERRRREGPFDLRGANAVFIASSHAYPENLDFEGIRWTAGLATWKKLAAKGIWIHGCTEGLGEKENPRLDILGGELTWVALSHGGAAPGERGPQVATYDLVPRADASRPEGAELHWTSAFLFEEALKRWPELKDRRHGCGPGKTLDVLKTKIDRPAVRWPVG